MKKQLPLDLGAEPPRSRKAEIIQLPPRAMRFADAAVEISDLSAKDADSIAFMTRVLVQATLPHRDPGIEAQGFARKNGYISLIIQPGLVALDDGQTRSIGIPYGALPRLLLAWINTEAVRTKERKIILGNSLSEFMRQLDLVPTGGRWGSITRLKEQMNRLFSARITFRYDKDIEAVEEMIITKKRAMWWDDKHPYQNSLFQSFIVLEQDFFDEMIKHPVPVDMRALKALRQSPLALDLYMWLTYRMSYLRNDTAIPWTALKDQFGSDYKHNYDFVKKAKKSLHIIQALYPDLKLEERRGRLILKPSPTRVFKPS